MTFAAIITLWPQGAPRKPVDSFRGAAAIGQPLKRKSIPGTPCVALRAPVWGALGASHLPCAAIVRRALFGKDRSMKIISGGQTGADRAALDVAIERGMFWGGWCPKGGWGLSAAAGKPVGSSQ
jgi:hypothetical protein